nr:hypothetical protein [Tanacetum cinerariifolium]
MFIEFVIQNQFFFYSSEEFSQILDIPCVFTDRWSLDELAYGVPSNGPCQTNLPSPDDIILTIEIDREGQVCRIRQEEEIDSENLERIVAREDVVTPLPPPPSIKHFHLILTMMMEMMKGPRRQSSFSFFLPSLSSSNHSTMNFTKDYSFNPSKKIKLTIIPPRQLFVNISSDEDVTTTPSSTTTYSSPIPPNVPYKTPSINQTSSSQENTSSSFQSKLQISPPSSNAPTSPQALNPLLDNILDVPPRPSNPQPLQSHPSLDITLSFSLITPLDHIYDTSLPPYPP